MVTTVVVDAPIEDQLSSADQSTTEDRFEDLFDDLMDEQFELLDVEGGRCVFAFERRLPGDGCLDGEGGEFNVWPKLFASSSIQASNRSSEL